MTAVVTHPFVSAVVDGADATLVRPSNWNADHTITGIMSASQGGTGIAYFIAAGPTVARTYTFPDADSTILVSSGALGTPSSGVISACTSTSMVMVSPLLGTPTSGVLTNCTGLPEGGLSLTDLTTNNASATQHGFVPKWPNNTTTFFRGDGTYAAPAAGSSTWDTIGAAAASTTTANAAFNIVYNTAPTADTKVAWTFGETSAGSGGTSTAGVPNQVLLKLTTLATSTQSPLSVYSSAAHVFSVSPTTAQILGTDGTGTDPTYSFAASVGTGIYSSAANTIAFSINTIQRYVFNVTALTGSSQVIRFATGSPSAPTYSFNAETNTGLWKPATSTLGISINGVENSRFLDAGIYQLSKGSADAVSYALNFRKSRGTVASPTVITTGDDLATISGYGYLGATNTYEIATQIKFDSTGTIADTTSGIGGIVRFSHAIVGTVGVTEIAKFDAQHLIHEGTAPTITAGGGTNPSIVGTDESFTVTIGSGGVATSVEVTFGHAFITNAPSVFVESDTDIVAFKVTPLTNKVTIAAALAFTAGSKLACGAIGWE